jgi:hypothetical protein
MKKLENLIETVSTFRNEGNSYIEDIKNLSSFISEKSIYLDFIKSLDSKIREIEKKYSPEEFDKLVDCCQELIVNEAKRKAKRIINLSEEKIEQVAKKFIK